MTRALALLVSLAFLLGIDAAKAQESASAKRPQADATLGTVDDKPRLETARLTIASDPADAVVSLTTKGAKGTVAKKGARVEDRAERILGRTPLTVEVPAGGAEVVIAKDGYVLKVEPLELQAGAAQRLEVRLTKDLPIPSGVSFKDTPALVKTEAEAEQLIDMVLHDVIALYVDEKDPRALIDAAARTLVESLGAVRERESLLRRELGEAARLRFYGDEVDLRSYAALTYTEVAEQHGKTRWSVAAGTVAVEGVTDPGDYETYRRKLHAIYSFIKNRWDLSSKLDDSMLARALIDGLLTKLDDVHTHFLTPEAYREMGDETAGHFSGVGIVVGARDGGSISVVAPMEGTPGEKAGILAGDRIVGIDGRSTDGMLLSEVIRLMRGEPGSKIELTIRRGDQAPFKVTLERASIAIRNTKTHLLAGEPKVGYLRISSFMADKLEEEVAKALDDLEAKGAQAIVLDLRNNPGGLLQKAVQIAETLVAEKSVVVSTRGRLPLMCKTFEAGAGPKRKRLPMAILVNEGSASASEILAGTLREHGVATLVGERTYGKGSVQRVIPLEPFGSALALTVATYHLPSGVTPHKKGIDPDVVVKLSEEEKILVASRSVYSTFGGDTADRQLDAAVGELKKKLAPR